MSRNTYVRGFVKAAEARGVDPLELVGFMKRSSSFSDTLSQIGSGISRAWKDVPKEYKPLVSGLVGAAGGAGIGALGGKLLGFGAGRGALAGLGLGGIGGALYGSHAAGKQYGEENDQELAKREKEHANAVAGMNAKHLSEIAERDRRIAEQDESMDRASETINKNEELISKLRGDIASADSTISARDKTIADNLAEIQRLSEESKSLGAQLGGARQDLLAMGRSNEGLNARLKELEAMGLDEKRIAAMSDAELKALEAVIANNMSAMKSRARSLKGMAKDEAGRRAEKAKKEMEENWNTAEGIADSSRSGAKSKADLTKYYKALSDKAWSEGNYEEAERLSRLAAINASLPEDGRTAMTR